MSLTAKDVAEIIKLLEESSFDELELEAGDLKLSLRRGVDGVAPSTASRSPSPVARGRTKSVESAATSASSTPPPAAGRCWTCLSAMSPASSWGMPQQTG